MSFLDPVLSPLLRFEPLFAIALLALLISLIITLAYKFFTDQELMKSLKSELKDLQKTMRSQKDNPEKMMATQKIAMEKNMKYLTHSMRPSLITLIPIIFLFGWLNANFTYVPIQAGDTFFVDVYSEADFVNFTVIPDGVIIGQGVYDATEGKSRFELSGDAGEYVLQIKYGSADVELPLIIGNGYATPDTRLKGDISRVIIGNEKLRVSLLGWEMGWLWAYIIFSILFSIAIRKLFKVY